MKKIVLFAMLAAICVFYSPSFAANENAPAQVTLNGKVVDITSGEALAGVAITIEGTQLTIYTDLDGNFTLTGIKPGNYNLVCSYLSYKKSLIENLDITKASRELFTIALQPAK
jgi:hypothetical protein